jgi:hypothetical protein
MAPRPGRSPLQLLQIIAFWTAPPLVALLLYWPGLTAWFQRDDFAWLGLREAVRNGPGLKWALFAPLAQGTIRTLSERIFFLTFSGAFGMHALPYRTLAFLTHFANLTTLSLVCAKLTRSRAAGFWAAIFWTVNSAMAVALSWTSAYSELMWCFFVLLGFWFLMHYAETGEPRFLIVQWVAFLLGFGALELNVVYPALALVYALCCARRLIWKTVPMFAVSTVYTAVHMAVAPLSTSGPYKMYCDVGILKTLVRYCAIALGPGQLSLLGVAHGRTALAALLAIGLLAFLAWKLYRREWVAALFPAWFVIVLAPLLPLKDHISDYYLTAPLIGLSMWGGWAVAAAWKSGSPARVAGVALAALYLAVAIPVARYNTTLYHDVSMRIRDRILGVVVLHQAYPDKAVFLTGVDDEFQQTALLHMPFRLVGIPEVHVLPADEALLDANQAVIYDASRDRDVTGEYRRARTLKRKVDAGDDAAADQFGEGWYPKEDGFRWSAGRAGVRLRGPGSAENKLYVTGYLPEQALKSGPVRLTIRVEDEKPFSEKIDASNARFSFAVDLPVALIGRPSIDVVVELNRTFRPAGDSRELGAVFGSFEIR